MDSKFLFSTHPSFLLERLITQYKKQDKLVIAYDFDDTVRPMYCANCDQVQSLLRKIKDIILSGEIGRIVSIQHPCTMPPFSHLCKCRRISPVSQTKTLFSPKYP